MADRYDSKRRRLKVGESERGDGYYQYRTTDRYGKRHTITAKTLEELRKREDQLVRDKLDGIRQCSPTTTLNKIYNLWKKNKRGLKDNTFNNYCWTYEQYVQDDIGLMHIQKIKRSDVKRFYNKLYEDRGLSIASIDNVHTVLHQVFQVAVDDDYIRKNISDNLLKELKQAYTIGDKHRKALTVAEQNLFLDFIKNNRSQYYHWSPIFEIMIETGLRVGEITGLRWDDIDIDKGTIDINHTLIYYNHRVGNNTKGCYFGINTPKTKAGCRIVPMTETVKAAFQREKEIQELLGIECTTSVDGYTGFIFVNRFGNVQHQGTLNKAIRRIIRDVNDQQNMLGKSNPVLLPNFSCHTLRHTFVTRLCEAGVNLKVIQEIAGHSRSDVTLDIYTSVMDEFKEKEFSEFQNKMNK